MSDSRKPLLTSLEAWHALPMGDWKPIYANDGETTRVMRVPFGWLVETWIEGDNGERSIALAFVPHA